MKKMPVSQTQAEMWVLLADRQTVRFNFPPVPFWGLTRPVTLLRIFLGFDATAVDEMLERLTELRAQMLPAPMRN